MIKKMTIHLMTINNVKEFVDYTSSITDANFDVSHGPYVIDGKSILGLFSLDITKPLTLTITAGSNEQLESISNVLSKYC